jgi:hypothetical protein
VSGRWWEGEGDPASEELRNGLEEARLRMPDDVTLRRMWAEVSRAEVASDADVAHPADAVALVAEAGRRRRAPHWLWFAGGMASTAAVALAFALWPRPVAPKTQLGTPVVSSASQTQAASADATTAAMLAPGTVRTGEGETLRLTLRGSGAEARLGPSSVMSLEGEDRPTVEAGEVSFSVPHQPPGHAFVVQAGPYRVMVVGTKFHVRVEGTDRERQVFVSVDEGVVEVWDRTRLARLEPGGTWASPGGTETPAAAPGEPERAAPADGVESARSPTHVHHQVTRARVVAPAAPAAPDADARAALAAGDVTRALGLYRALAQRGGPAGENAEYEIGKILRDRLGQPANAVAAWRRYRTEHPDGILRVEADVSIVETLVHGGDMDGALAEAGDFLRRHPDSERRAEMARVAGDLYRARGDCRHAVGAYQTALASPRAAAVAEAATFHRASCLAQLGSPAGAEAARDYLRSWPAGRFRAEAAALAAATTPARASSEGAEGAPGP